MNSLGTDYKLTIIGSSHGNLVGVLIDGIPSGVPIDLEQVEQDLFFRRPGQSKVTTPRTEKDGLILETGIFEGKTTGGPILAYVRNKDADSTYYHEIRNTPRPGHADYPAHIRYPNTDYRGGGRASGRMTIGIVIAGAIARQIIEYMGHDIKIQTYARMIGGISTQVTNTEDSFIYSEDNPVRVPDPDKIDKIVDYILELKNEGDSCGGTVETVATGLPVGLGEPFFDSLESKIAHMVFSIPSIKGIEFGKGFALAGSKGSEANDPFIIIDGTVKTETNHSGGILGGFSTGMPMIFRCAIKPTSSIAKEQKTIDLSTQEQTTLIVKGRHDPCIVPRVVPVLRNATYCVLLDLLFSYEKDVKK